MKDIILRAIELSKELASMYNGEDGFIAIYMSDGRVHMTTDGFKDAFGYMDFETRNREDSQHPFEHSKTFGGVTFFCIGGETL